MTARELAVEIMSADELYPDSDTPIMEGRWTWVEAKEKRIEKALVEFALSAIKAALEEAQKAACEKCADGWILDGDDHIKQILNLNRFNPTRHKCEAVKIRSLNPNDILEKIK